MILTEIREVESHTGFILEGRSRFQKSLPMDEKGKLEEKTMCRSVLTQRPESKFENAIFVEK